ncbi:unnamed protein product [Mytilus coruscus]|uniref:CCHC-type domain-containing protein n=1 Tax=Mytilus coruscus TaxID=42192 RepID=A0A6J8CD51_MYTCO|nr:unnamed protein product [Mytilus coruscus]
MGGTRKSLWKKQNKNEVPESTPDQDRVQQHLSPDLEVQPNIINDSISGSYINAKRQNTDINADNIDFRLPDPNAHISVSEVMHVMSETMKNNNCLTQTLTNVLKELPKNMSKSEKGDCNLPRSQSVRINDEFSSDEDTEIYDPRLRSYDRASSLDRPSNISLNSKFKVKLPIFSGIESWKVWFSRFSEVADRRGWNKDDRLDELLQRLHGQAGDFAYGQLPRRVRQDYDLLIDELNSRYRVIETSKTLGVKFSHRNQHPHESVEEGRQTRREDLLRRFLDGLQDDTARFQVEYNKEPHDIDEVVAHVVNFVETKARLSKSDPYYERKPRRQTRKIEVNPVDETDYSSDEDSREGAQLIKTVHKVAKEKEEKNEGLKGNKVESAPDSEDKRVQGIVKLVLQNLNSQKEDMETFDKEYKQLGHNAKGSNSDIRTCFCCGKEAHIARNCWKRGNTQNQEKKK